MENFKLIEEKENPLFNRKEIVFELNAKVTPSREEVGKLILEKFSTQIENVKIKKIHGTFGSNNFNVVTFIYKSEQDKNNVERKRKKDDLIKPKEVVEEKKEEKVEEVKSSEENVKQENKESSSEVDSK